MARATLSEQYQGKLRPISKAMINYCHRESAKHLYIKNSITGECVCPSCDNEIVVGKTKHKQSIECPLCHKSLIVEHTTRMSKYIEEINFYATVQALDEKALVIRYVLAYENNKGRNIEEVARFYIHEDYAEPCYSTLCGKEWKDGKGTYFRTPCYMIPNRFFCMYANEYRIGDILRNAQKLDCFKYYPVAQLYDKKHLVSQLHYLVRSARLNEKLYKIGFEKINEEHSRYYMYHNDRTIRVKANESSLMGMLGLDKVRFDLFRESKTLNKLSFLQSHKDINVEIYRACKFEYEYDHYLTLMDKLKVSATKLINYIKKQDLIFSEYEHFIRTIESLGYNVQDTYYSMPKDFRAFEQKITEEMNNKTYSEQNKQIKEISEALHNLPNLKDYMQGSNGLMIYVPENANDLINEGKAMHNCIGTYIDRIADNKTLVFFIRRLSDKNAPFVAFEYCNGTIVQCMYDHNERVPHDTEVYQFAEAFSSALRERKVLVA